MRVLVLGASGMLGFVLHRVLHDSGYTVSGALRATKRPVSPWCEGLEYVFGVDVEKFADVVRAIETTRATKVINAVGVVEQHDAGIEFQRRLFAVNSKFPRLLGGAASSLGVQIIHFSSDGVFSGRRGMYIEGDIPDANDAYGVSKFLGEPAGENVLVLRTSLLGRGIERNNSLLDWFLVQIGEVHGYRRVIFSGLPVNEIALLLAQRILPRSEPLVGLFHLSAAPITKLELLRTIRDEWSLNVSVEPQEFPAVDRSLDSTKLRHTIGYAPAAWPDLVAEMHSFYRGLDARDAAK